MSGPVGEAEPGLQPRQVVAQVEALARQLERENARIQAAGRAGLSRGKVAGLLQELTGVLEECARESGELVARIRHVRGVLAGTRDGLRLAGGRDRCAKEHHGNDDPKDPSVGNLRKSVDEAMTVAEKAEGTAADVAREASAAILEDAQELNHLECIEDEPEKLEDMNAENKKSEEETASESTGPNSNEVSGDHSENNLVDETPETEGKVADDEKESEEDKTKEVRTDEETVQETEKKDNDVKDDESKEKTNNKSTVVENDTKHSAEKKAVTKSVDRSPAPTKTKAPSPHEKKHISRDREQINLNSNPEEDDPVDKKAPANPGIWSTFPFDAQNEDGQSELACLIKVDIQAVTNFPVTCQITNHLAPSALAQNEELVSHVVQLSPAGLKLPAPAVVSLPYTWSRHVSRELAVKATSDGESWKTVPLKASDVVYKDRKGHFVEFEVSCLACYVVVSRLKVETFNLQKSKTKPNVFRSSVDQRIELNFPPGSVKTAGVLKVQVQPVDSGSLSALKSRCADCDTLITTSPIVSLSLSPGLRLHKPVDVTVPCPLNPAGNWARDPARPGTAGLGGSRKLGGSSPRPGSAPAGRTSAMEEGDNGDDFLHLLGQPEGEDGWAEVMDVRFRQNKKGLVTFETTELPEKFIVLRTADPAAEQFQGLTETLPRLLETSLTLVIQISPNIILPPFSGSSCCGPLTPRRSSSRP
ncbi:death domain-containing protein 1-like [Branchiostoma lanceolatum]|uniref:death domain-containing protein 1-like n=1 Tax=Branchiostoma lanceolatum TaxID=7740 RepID=UPI0034518745